MTASDSVILPINYIIWRKSGPVLTGPTGPAPTPLQCTVDFSSLRICVTMSVREYESSACRACVIE